MTKDRLGQECKTCVKSRVAAFERSSPLRRFGKNLKRKYWKNLKWQQALAEYNKLLKKQKGVCKICRNPETKTMWGKVRTLSVDHCHNTGKVRALLCDACNVAEGLLKNPKNAMALAAYMRHHA